MSEALSGSYVCPPVSLLRRHRAGSRPGGKEQESMGSACAFAISYVCKARKEKAVSNERRHCQIKHTHPKKKRVQHFWAAAVAQQR
eukprot:1142220-Pelagomonas_calceolata.AAC.2